MRSAAPEAPAPTRAAEVIRSSVGPTVVVKGDVQSREEFFIDGEVEGTLILQQRLTVGPNGKIRATIKAREVVVQGSIHGNVHAADKIVIRKDATLVGDIRAAGIVIDDGAFFKGSIDIVREAPRPAAAEPVLARAAGSVA